jgi:hypothetical protein
MESLRTEAECLAMALEMDKRADRSRLPGQIADLRYMANCWRSLSRQAAWQDRHCG